MKKPKPFDPFLCFVNARGMHLASFAIEEYVNTKPHIKNHLFWPEMIMEAFGLELHLKCLHAVRGHFEGGHGIKDLYKNLDPKDKQEIEARLTALIAKNPHYADVLTRGTQIDIDSILDRSDEMFCKGRYWHECEIPRTDSRGHIGDAGTAPLSDAIFELLLSINPDWWDKLKSFEIVGLDGGVQHQ
jgi:hypothetical protein